MTRNHWLIICTIVLLFPGFSTFAGKCPVCFRGGHDAANCPESSSPSERVDIRHFPGVPGSDETSGAMALLAGDILLREHSFSADRNHDPREITDEPLPAPQWITSISANAPTTTFSDTLEPENSYSVPGLNEELAHAQQGDSYELIEPLNNQLTLEFLDNHLTLASTQYLLNYLVVYPSTGEVLTNQIYIIEIDSNGHLFVLSNIDLYWNTVSQLEDIDEFIHEVFADSINAGDRVYLYQHIPNPDVQGQQFPSR